MTTAMTDGICLRTYGGLALFSSSCDTAPTGVICGLLR